MHFAYPPRKSSNPPPFRPRSGQLPSIRRGRLRTIALAILALVFVCYLVFKPSNRSPYHERQPAGTPPVVLVTVLDTKQYSSAYTKTVRENREKYAAKHGKMVKAIQHRRAQANRKQATRPSLRRPMTTTLLELL